MNERDRLAQIIAEADDPIRWQQAGPETRRKLNDRYLPSADAVLAGFEADLVAASGAAGFVGVHPPAAEGDAEFVQVGTWLLPEAYGNDYDHFTMTRMKSLSRARVAVYARPEDLAGTPAEHLAAAAVVFAAGTPTPPPLLLDSERKTVENWVRGIEQDRWNPTPSTKRLLGSILRAVLAVGSFPVNEATK